MFENKLGPKGSKKLPRNPSAKSPQHDTLQKMWSVGDNYGIGIKQPVGKMRGGSPGINPVPQNKLKVDPNSLA